MKKFLLFAFIVISTINAVSNYAGYDEAKRDLGHRQQDYVEMVSKYQTCVIVLNTEGLR